MSLRLHVFVSLFACFIASLKCSEIETGYTDVSDVNAKLLEMEKRIRSQEYRINGLEGRVRKQDKEIHDLKSELSSLRPKVRKIESGFYNLQNIIRRKKLFASDPEKVHTDSDVKPVLDKEPKTSSIEREARNLLPSVSSEDTAIGFYAYMSANEDTPGKHHPLVFNVVKTNKGNAYNGFTGVFTAPSGGLYVFSSSIRMNHGYAVYDIIKNGQVEGSFFVDAEDNSENRYSSSTITIELKQADVIMVRTSATYNPHGRIISDVNGRTSFTGWRLQ